jgi:hypothetical protein
MGEVYTVEDTGISIVQGTKNKCPQCKTKEERRVDSQVDTNVLEEHTVSVLRAENDSVLNGTKFV